MLTILEISERATSRAIDAGICDKEEDAKDAVLALVRLAVPFTHRMGNFRYADYVFRVEGVRVVDISMIRCEHCSDKGYVLVQDYCGFCDPDNPAPDCPDCHGRGSKLAKIRCQDCKKS